MTGVTSEYAINSQGVQVANDYSIQLNTNTFSTSACSGISGCMGWEQFIYSTSMGKFFIQFWMINHGLPCPTSSGWKEFAFTIDCFKNSTAVTVPAEVITALSSLSITGQSSYTMTGTGVIPEKGFFYIGTDSYYVTDSGNDTLGLQYAWYQSEFNVFGDGNVAQEAQFNPGATIKVNVSMNGQPYTAVGREAISVSCVEKSMTGETNNLTLGSTCSETPGTEKNGIVGSAYISFTESD